MSEPTARPRLTLGLNTCYAVKRWPQPEQWAQVAVDLGISAIQLSLDLLPLGDSLAPAMRYAERTAEVAARTGLTVHSAFTGLAAYSSSLLLADDAQDREDAERWYAGMIAVAAAAGASGFGGHVGALSVSAAANPGLRADRIAWELDAMARLAEVAAAEGLDHLQFENLAVTREYGHSVAEAHAIEEALVGSAVPWRLCLDLGHPPALPPSSGSNDPTRWLEESWRSTPVVQLQQSPWGADHHGPFTPETNAQGAVDRDAVLARMIDWPPEDIPMFFEIIHPHEAPDETVVGDLRQSIEFWREGMARLGQSSQRS